MTTGEKIFAVAARSCALFLLLLLLAASFPSARSSTSTGMAGSDTNNSAPAATKGPHGSSASAAVNTSEAAEVAVTEILIDGEVRPLDDECFEVCCWQGDANCPYPYCNYNQSPCNGD